MTDRNASSAPRVEESGVVLTAVDKTKALAFDDDIVVVERFLAGDEAAFEILYSRYHDKVHAIARGILLDAEEASDVVQEIFTLVLRHLKRFDRRSRFSTWLFRVAVNRSIQEARKARHKHRHVELREASDATVPEEVEYSDPKIQAAMEKMAPNDRAILVLFYWEELSLNEIADSLGCNVNAAKTRLYRARERFRSLYEESES
ncbi:MAG: sigma-70 family RNA polymerase sigma factor [Fimbriimonadaceae bacterium]|nr:sigma-70 family RNA polymerase sigma factor [Fimbriimonadaceae bacterium]